MYKVIYTKSLENSDDIVAKSFEYIEKDLAISLFKDKIRNLLIECLENSFCKAKISMHHNKALIKIEDTHYCIAVVDDLNKEIKGI